jgi:3-dehydrotetronate 4-kinase
MIKNSLKLGCVADDFTGATDLANNLVRAGMRVLQTIGVPDAPLEHDVDAVVVALKSRTIAPEEAVRQSLQALAWLQSQGSQQIYFKYCSTFDSTAQGNIGPVTEAGLSRQPAHRLQGPFVRRRRAAERKRHAKPPADPHA